MYFINFSAKFLHVLTPLLLSAGYLSDYIHTKIGRIKTRFNATFRHLCTSFEKNLSTQYWTEEWEILKTTSLLDQMYCTENIHSSLNLIIVIESRYQLEYIPVGCGFRQSTEKVTVFHEKMKWFPLKLCKSFSSFFTTFFNWFKKKCFSNEKYHSKY